MERRTLRFLSTLLISLLCLTTAHASTPSLQQQLGQLLMVGFHGIELHDNDPIVQDILAQRIGGVVLYAKDQQTKQIRNIKDPQQLAALTRQLQQYALQAAHNHHNDLYPLLIAVDYEGGQIVNLKPEMGFPVTQPAAELGQYSPDKIKQAAEQMALTLKQAGINFDFAPVLDVNVNPQNPIIAKYGRSFSSNPQQVATDAAIFSKAFRDQHILCAYKHFPGHGSSTADSHLGLVDISKTWQRAELIPYQQLSQNKDVCDFVMTGHLVNHVLDPQDYPATLSHAMTTDLLRQQVGFKGLVITDDLQMGAIDAHYDVTTRVRLALQAGADMLLFSNQLVKTPQDTQELLSIMQQQVQSGAIPSAQVGQSYQRIVQLKRGLK